VANYSLSSEVSDFMRHAPCSESLTRAQVLAWCGGAILLSTLSYPLLQLAREREWCRFVGSSPHEFKAQLRGQLPSARTSFASLADVSDLDAPPAPPTPERSPLLGNSLNGETSENGRAS